jgi:hypothetical protein
VLALGGKTAHGSDVSDWWAEGDLARIAAYCREDVRLTYRVFCKLMFQQIPERYRIAVEHKALDHVTSALTTVDTNTTPSRQ